MKKAILGGIVKSKGGYGFRTCFQTQREANHYKDMIRFILQDDNLKVNYETAMFDKERYKDAKL